MSKGFRPLFRKEEDTPKEEFRDETQKLLEEKKRLEETLSKLEAELRKERSQKEELLKELEQTRLILEQKEDEVKDLTSELTSSQEKLKLLEGTITGIRESLGTLKSELRGELVNLSIEVIKEFLMRDVVPKEELVVKILEQVFEGSFELKGSIKVQLNPADMDSVFEFIAGIREKLGDRVDIEVVSSDNLQPGEITIETPKFVIERKHGEILSEVMSEVLKSFYEGS